MQAVRKEMSNHNPTASTSQRVDVEALMSRIRQDVRGTLADAGSRIPRSPQMTAGVFDGSTIPLVHSDELNFLNANWTGWITSPEFSSHRPGIGKVIVKAKYYASRFVLEVCFKGFFKRLYDFNWNVVQYCNRSARYTDSRDAQIFWQLINKLDNDIQAINDKCDLLYDEVLTTLQKIESKVSDNRD